MTKHSNKNATLSLGGSILSVFTLLMMAILPIVISIIAIIKGIQGLNDYHKDNSIGGKTQAIVGLIISSIVLFIILLPLFWL